MNCYWMYLSRARVPAHSPDNALIYLQSRNRNPKVGITGYLHREADFYVQYIEGPKAAITDLSRRIRRDGRHGGIRALDTGTLEARRFDGWDMAFSTDEVMAFRDYQAARGREVRIDRASHTEILAFMEHSMHAGAARSVHEVAS